MDGSVGVSRLWRVRAWIRGVAVGAVAFLGALQAVVLGQVERGELPASEAQLGWLAIGVGILAGYLLTFRPTVTLGDGGLVEIRNPVRVRRFRREEVIAVVPNEYGLVFVLRDGRRVSSLVFQNTMSWGEPRWFDVAEAVTGCRPRLLDDGGLRGAMLDGMELSHLNLRVRDAVACRAFYERHFWFRLAFEAEGGSFLRNDSGFLLALVPVEDHRPLPPGFHIGFRLDEPDAVLALHSALSAVAVRTGALEDSRPGEGYVTFRCWDPDGTEVEVFWDGP